MVHLGAQPERMSSDQLTAGANRCNECSWDSWAILALNSRSLLFLLLYGKLGLDLLLLLQEFIQSFFWFLQLLFQLLLLRCVSLCLAEFFEIAFDLFILIIDKLSNLLKSQRWILAWIVVFITLCCLHNFNVLSWDLGNDVNYLWFRM